MTDLSQSNKSKLVSNGNLKPLLEFTQLLEFEYNSSEKFGRKWGLKPTEKGQILIDFTRKYNNELEKRLKAFDEYCEHIINKPFHVNNRAKDIYEKHKELFGSLERRTKND